MKGIKTVARCALFFAILGFVSVNIYNVFTWKNTKGIICLNNLPRNNADVLFIGSSHSHCTVNTALLWEDFGIAACDISEASQPLMVGYHYLKEAMKTQRPKVVFVELFGYDIGIQTSSGAHYRNTLNMKWSKNYFDNAKVVIADTRTRITDPETMKSVEKGIYLKFPVIHARYNELTEEDFKPNPNLRYHYNWSVKPYEYPETMEEKGIAELAESQQPYLDGMVELSKQYGFKLVFWVAPYVAPKEKTMQFNAVEQFARENGADYYGFPEIVNATGFDFSTDMRKEKGATGHINSFGSMKVTRYLGQILSETYHMPDRRNESGYGWFEQAAKEWDEVFLQYRVSVAKNLQEYLEAIDADWADVTVVNYKPEVQWPDAPAFEALSKLETAVPGFYTKARWKQLNGVWELSDRVKLILSDGDKRQVELFDGSTEMSMEKCVVCVIVVNRETGALVCEAGFGGAGGDYRKL